MLLATESSMSETWMKNERICFKMYNLEIVRLADDANLSRQLRIYHGTVIHVQLREIRNTAAVC